MRAVRFDGHTVSLDRAAAEPVLAEGEVLIKPTRVAIGSLDRRATMAGSAFTGVPGHAFTGVVEALGPMSPAMAERGAKVLHKRVSVAINVACGLCDLCKIGLSQHCRKRTVLGLFGRDGGLAERVAVPLANVMAVPEGVEEDRAALAVLVGSAAHAAVNFRVEGKPYITVLGDGPLGLLAVQVMARLNASVRLLGKHPSKLELCERWGIKHRLVSEAGRRQDQDVVVDCTGRAEGLVDALGLVRPRGKVIVKSCDGLAGVSVGAAAAAGLMEQVVQREIEVLGSRCGTLSEGLALLNKRTVQVEGLITARGKLEDAPGLLGRAAPGGLITMIEVR